ncbi:hypothetical protein Asppvi_010362 [Aspergillus pseudoviridinutans]|uniref:AB hydrolase-1 domain-containing protein n=1 Tax=Aspergillus pseudoviridinutans TaxID=1517512 RepID=A0A9P3BHJ3_9EURO|nr:uncharacterized protein Asppvi_010362 [Aspergillus pseudoviridinutans]GIJ91397.1 hypothetical protein Asppvi_010362 [Aspergillus pseudoviridinutans]
MAPVDSGQLFLLAGIAIIACLWLLGTNHALQREYPKRRDEQLGAKQPSTTRQPLEVLYPDPSDKVNGEAEVDIIAVHGLGSNVDWSWTWKSKTRDIHWLRDRDMLPNVVPKSRIMVYNYDSKWHSNAPQTRLQICGEDLIRSVHNFRNHNGMTGRPILLIGHSLGGNVIQHALLYADSEAEFSYLPKLIVGLVFLGSPFRGSALQPVASFAARVLSLAQSHAGIINDLEYDSPTMTDKLHSFCRLRERMLIPTSCFFELYATDYGRKIRIPGLIKGMARISHEWMNSV